jgi:hypothetical protein
MKREPKTKFYIRYADDFVILSQNKDYLLELTPRIADFLEENLKLLLHPDKLFLKTLNSGVDFLGWVQFPDHRVLRTSTKNRMFEKLGDNLLKATLNSYLGLLSHGNAHKLAKKIKGIKSLT